MAAPGGEVAPREVPPDQLSRDHVPPEDRAGLPEHRIRRDRILGPCGAPGGEREGSRPRGHGASAFPPVGAMARSGGQQDLLDGAEPVGELERGQVVDFVVAADERAHGAGGIAPPPVISTSDFRISRISLMWATGAPDQAIGLADDEQVAPSRPTRMSHT